MIFSTEAVLKQLSIHKVGNKSVNEPLALSEQPAIIHDETLALLVKQYFTAPFEKVHEIYRLSHPTGEADLNEVYRFAKEIFDDASAFHANSRKLAQQLYELSDHPRIRGGEFYVAYLEKMQIEGELMDALGIFRSETKETYLKVMASAGAFDLSYEQEAINIKKLDKGCLIFNTEAGEGYKVAVIDATNKGTEAVYWVDDFLQLKIRNDQYNQTHHVLQLYKDFITGKIEETMEVSRPDKIDLLNRSIRYFKENEEFRMDEFSQVVLDNPVAISEWNNYRKNCEQESGQPIDESFSISNAAVKKQARHFKSVLKLDKNFHIYIHGNRDLIEKGFDEGMRMHYYKVYFQEEQ